MGWSTFLAILALIFMILSTLKYYQIQKAFKKLEIGDTISNELVDESLKKNRVALTLFGISSVLGIIGVLIRPY